MSLGRVAIGINNIYTLFTDEGKIMCRIKGKKLIQDTGRYNPIAVGDWVEYENDSNNSGHGLIIERRERKNVLARLNRKRGTMQTMVANMDLLICMTSPESPPFRPRFIDRVLVAASIGDMPVMILVNKTDQNISAEMENRLKSYRELGCEVRYCSAADGRGVEELSSAIEGRDVAFVGQSGVGKSTLLNRIVPGAELATGDITQKYNRGSHTTTFAKMIEKTSSGRLVDTPGIREIDIAGIEALDLDHYFPEFKPLLDRCGFASCYHDQEPRCAIRQGVEDGRIHPDRYESYLRILEQLKRTDKGYGQGTGL